MAAQRRVRRDRRTTDTRVAVSSTRHARGPRKHPRIATHDGVRHVCAGFRRIGATRQRPPCGAADRHAARTPVAGARQTDRSGDRRSRTSARVSGQRSAGHRVGGCGAHVSQSLRRKARRTRHRPHRDGFGVSRGCRLGERGRRRSRHCRRAAQPRWPRCRGGAGTRHSDQAIHHHRRNVRASSHFTRAAGSNHR